MSELKQREIRGLLKQLSILPAVLLPLVIDYCYSEIPWKVALVQQLPLPDEPWSIASDSDSIYITSDCQNCIYHCSLNPLRLIDTWTYLQFSFQFPGVLDLIGHELFISEYNIQVLDLKAKTVSRIWSLSGYSYGMKVSGNEIFVSLFDQHQINVYDRSSGTLIRRFGKMGSNPGEFRTPYGVTVDEHYIYVCDQQNCRIQVLYRSKGAFSHQWGTIGTGNTQFFNPTSIYLSTEEDLIYVGDYYGVKGFTKRGEFRQRFGTKKSGNRVGQFYFVTGIIIMNNQLYVVDRGNKRMQVWM